MLRSDLDECARRVASRGKLRTAFALVLQPLTAAGRIRIAMSAAALCCVLSGSGCGASNPYGFGREYTPSGDEERYYESALDVSYEDVRRDPAAYSGRLLGWFGVVEGVARLPSGAIQLSLDLRFHQPRHLCTDQFESSCRVTISERAGGPFSTTVNLHPEDATGSERLNVGSLVKVYGSPNGDFDARGGPVLTAQWYRQWPHGAYVTTVGHTAMRR
jgi:hypothetical protein